MRVGFNPHKDKIQTASEYTHQVIIPVYIPHLEGYFKDSFEILKLCLDSLFVSKHHKTFVTIVNNGSCLEVANEINEQIAKERLNYDVNKKKVMDMYHNIENEISK